jgi:uncharacterized RDD family membrane protein YckC
MTDIAGVSPVPREARPFQGHSAGVVTRTIAAVIDGLVVAAVLVAAYAVLAGFMFMLNPRSFQFPDAGWLLSLIAGFWVLVVYLTVAWSIGGRSYGARIMGLRVVGRRGSKLRPALAFLRALACAVFPIGLMWCAVNRHNRSLQDILLGTAVIYDWMPGRPEPHLGSGENDDATE